MKIYNVNINGFWFNTNELFLAEDEIEAKTAAYQSRPEATKLKVKTKIFKDNIVVKDLLTYAQDLGIKQMLLLRSKTDQSLQVNVSSQIFLDAFDKDFLKAKILHMGSRLEDCRWFTVDF